MVRSRKILEVIEKDNLVKHAEETGNFLLQQIEQLAQEFPQLISNPRGKGLICAFDLPTTELRDKLIKEAFKRKVILLGAGEKTIRFRPALIITKDDIQKGFDIIKDILTTLK